MQTCCCWLFVYGIYELISKEIRPLHSACLWACLLFLTFLHKHLGVSWPIFIMFDEKLDVCNDIKFLFLWNSEVMGRGGNTLFVGLSTPWQGKRETSSLAAGFGTVLDPQSAPESSTQVVMQTQGIWGVTLGWAKARQRYPWCGGIVGSTEQAEHLGFMQAARTWWVCCGRGCCGLVQGTLREGELKTLRKNWGLLGWKVESRQRRSQAVESTRDVMKD